MADLHHLSHCEGRRAAAELLEGASATSRGRDEAVPPSPGHERRLDIAGDPRQPAA